MDKPPLGVEQIRRLLPHRYPMLLVDRVLEITPCDVVAEKRVSQNEPFFEGHFPGMPIMPGLLIIEAIAQSAAVGRYWNEPDSRGRGVALLTVKGARFRRPVVPGDVLRLSTHLIRKRGSLCRFKGTASVEGQTAAETEFLAAFIDWETPE